MSTSQQTLVVQVMGVRGEPPTILEIERPVGGTVRLREWPNGQWTRPPHERESSCEELMQRLERARKEGRHVTEDEHRVRAWLEGRA
jgi:hypothetical protein